MQACATVSKQLAVALGDLRARIDALDQATVEGLEVDHGAAAGVAPSTRASGESTISPFGSAAMRSCARR